MGKTRIHTDITADSGDAQKAFKGLNGSINKSKKAMAGVGPSANSAGTAFKGMGKAAAMLLIKLAPLIAAYKALSFVKGAVTGTAKLGDQLAKMAQKTGIAVEQLSGLKHAAELSGTSLEAVGKATRKMSMDIVSKTKMSADAFAALGVSTVNAEGKTRPMVAILMDVADKMAKMENGTKKTGLAAAIFGGRVGQDLIPMLNQGAAGIKAMMDENKALGNEMSTGTAKASEVMNDNLQRVGNAIDAVKLAIGDGLIPVVGHVADKFVDWWKANQQLMTSGIKEFIGDVVTWLKSVDWGSILADLKGFISTTITVFSTMKDIYEGFIATIDAVTMAIAKTVLAVENAINAVKRFFGGEGGGGEVPGGPTDIGDMGQYGMQHGGPVDTIPAMLTPGEYVMNQGAVSKYGVGFMGAINARRYAKGGYVRGYQEGGEVEGGGDIEAGGFQALFGGGQNLWAQMLQPPEDFATIIEPALMKFNEAMTEVTSDLDPVDNPLMRMLSMTPDQMEDMELPEDFMPMMNMKLRDAASENEDDAVYTSQMITGVHPDIIAKIPLEGITQKFAVISKESSKAAQTIGGHWSTALGGISGILSNVTTAFASESGKQSGIAKAAAVAQTVQNTYSAAMGAYAAMSKIPIVGPVLGIAAAAAAVAAGVANVAKIKSAEEGAYLDEPAGAGVPVIAHGGEGILNREATEAIGGKEGVDSLNAGGGGGGAVTINIETIIGEREWVEDNIVPLIQDAARRDVATDFEFKET